MLKIQKFQRNDWDTSGRLCNSNTDNITNVNLKTVDGYQETIWKFHKNFWNSDESHEIFSGNSKLRSSNVNVKIMPKKTFFSENFPFFWEFSWNFKIYRYVLRYFNKIIRLYQKIKRNILARIISVFDISWKNKFMPKKQNANESPESPLAISASHPKFPKLW